LLQSGDRLNEYEVLRVLGAGGSTITYLARDQTGGAQVVLKCLRDAAQTDRRTRRRLRRELAILRRLDGPAIQGAAHDAIIHDGACIVLKYVEGSSLRVWLSERQPLTIDTAVRIGARLAAAIAYAHGHGVVHRDLKPENVLVLPDGSVKLIDFGSALVRRSQLLDWRHHGQSAGTPDYMAPEQVARERGDVRTDIYALGAILYELFTGTAPFAGDSPNAVLYQQVHSTPPSPLLLRPDLPPTLAAITLKALQKRPEDRYQRAVDVQQDLELQREPPVGFGNDVVTAAPGGEPAGTARWWQRGRS
jgi:serine/threonine protein kinase